MSTPGADRENMGSHLASLLCSTLTALASFRGNKVLPGMRPTGAANVLYQCCPVSCLHQHGPAHLAKLFAAGEDHRQNFASCSVQHQARNFLVLRMMQMLYDDRTLGGNSSAVGTSQCRNLMVRSAYQSAWTPLYQAESSK